MVSSVTLKIIIYIHLQTCQIWVNIFPATMVFFYEKRLRATWWSCRETRALCHSIALLSSKTTSAPPLFNHRESCDSLVPSAVYLQFQSQKNKPQGQKLSWFDESNAKQLTEIYLVVFKSSAILKVCFYSRRNALNNWSWFKMDVWRFISCESFKETLVQKGTG